MWGDGPVALDPHPVCKQPSVSPQGWGGDTHAVPGGELGPLGSARVFTALGGSWRPVFLPGQIPGAQGSQGWEGILRHPTGSLGSVTQGSTHPIGAAASGISMSLTLSGRQGSIPPAPSGVPLEASVLPGTPEQSFPSTNATSPRKLFLTATQPRPQHRPVRVLRPPSDRLKVCIHLSFAPSSRCPHQRASPRPRAPPTSGPQPVWSL